YRQLNRALFHAGVNRRGSYEFLDVNNGLHFYLLERSLNSEGILSYVVAVRSLHARVGSSVSLRLSAPTAVRLTTAAVPLVTVTAGTAPAALSTRDNALRSTLPDGDVYRIKVSTSSGGVEAALQSEVYWIPH